MPPKCIDLSVIIPVYNDGGTVSNVISKILSESRINIELIIVNDGSTDNTLDVINNFNDTRLFLINQDNQGVYAARNTALRQHKGKWVMFLDADDDFDNDMIYQRVMIAEKECIDVLITNGLITHVNNLGAGKTIHKKQIYNRIISGQTWIKNAVHNNEWPHYLWLQLISSNYIKENNLTFNAGHSHQDILWSACLALKNGHFFVLQSVDYYYHANPQSITNSKKYFDRRALNYIEVISKLISYSKEYKDLEQELSTHAVYECRHFIGLYRKKILNKKAVSNVFFEQINFRDLWHGATQPKQYWLIIRLYCTLKFSS